MRRLDEAMQRHVLNCEDCRIVAEEIASLTARLDITDEENLVPPGFAGRVMDQISRPQRIAGVSFTAVAQFATTGVAAAIGIFELATLVFWIVTPIGA
jgi:predicted anti-sigma-YlaC factor YlaD